MEYEQLEFDVTLSGERKLRDNVRGTVFGNKHGRWKNDESVPLEFCKEVSGG